MGVGFQKTPGKDRVSIVQTYVVTSFILIIGEVPTNKQNLCCMCRLLLYKEPFLPYSRDNKQE